MDLYELLMAGDADAATMARERAAALRKTGGVGAILAGAGGKRLAPLGGDLMQRQDQGEAALTGAGQTRLVDRRALAAAAAQKAQQDRQHALEQQRLGMDREKMEQDAWSAVPDQSGGVVMFNKKTGEARPMGPQGPGRPAGAGTGLKPAQFEADVQSFGKDVEPIAKAQPDVAALLNATKPDDVSGFGPVAGRVPNMLMTDEGVANRQAAGRLMAAIIQATSGQAASEKEVDRLLEANGMGRTATTPMLREGITKLQAQYQNLLKQREAKYHPQVVETYRERGGFTSQSAATPADQQAKAWADANPNDPRAAAILERLKAKGL
jgi:hypothetical protein